MRLAPTKVVYTGRNAVRLRNGGGGGGLWDAGLWDGGFAGCGIIQLRDYPNAGFSKRVIKYSIVLMRDCGTLNSKSSVVVRIKTQS